jgi:hypothetical protein
MSPSEINRDLPEGATPLDPDEVGYGWRTWEGLHQGVMECRPGGPPTSSFFLPERADTLTGSDFPKRTRILPNETLPILNQPY